MKKQGILGIVAGAGLMLSVAGGAMAEPQGVDWGANTTSSANSNNCIAYYSAPHRHNGHNTTLGQGGDPSHGVRGDEIKALQEDCNLANDNE